MASKKKRLVWLDLCSGLGGASQPALDRGWRVIHVDIDPRLKPDIVADVRALPLTRVNSMLAKAAKYPDVLWASPPCTEFSKHGLKCFFPNPPEPDLSIVLGVKRAIEELHPLFWMVENVWPSRPWLNKIFGPVTNRVPGHALWSNWQILLPNIPPHKGSFHEKHASGNRWGPVSRVKVDKNGREFIQKPAIAFGPKRYDPTVWFRKRGLARIGTGHNGQEAAQAAVIPYEIGEAICRAVEARA